MSKFDAIYNNCNSKHIIIFAYILKANHNKDYSVVKTFKAA